MEVMIGPTFSIVTEEYVRDRSLSGPLEKASSAAAASPCILSKNEEGGCPGKPGDENRSVIGIGVGDYSSDSSSSIGTPGESEDEVESGDDDGVSLEEDRLRGLGSMISLEDSLPIKRGLSNHYKGKSKSFGNLAEISSVKEVEKQENPLNKRRRLQICSKRLRRSFYSWQNPKSMPLLPVNEDEEDDGEEEDDRKSGLDETKSSVASSSDDDEGGRQPTLQGKKWFKAKNFKSHSCFALSDLQEEEDE